MIFLIWFALCILVSVYASGRGKSGLLYFFISLILSPLLGFIIALIVDDDTKRTCPNCGEKINIQAIECPHCSKEFKKLDIDSSNELIKNISDTTSQLIIAKDDSNISLEEIKQIVKNSYDEKYRAKITKDTDRLFMIKSDNEQGKTYIQIEIKDDKYIITAFNTDIPTSLEPQKTIIHQNNLDTTDKLLELPKLHEKGLLTKGEFEEQKRKIL